MENFVVSALKYRPKRFSAIKGQEHIITTLLNAIKNGQVAKAFLFCGLKGSGKTTSARLLAKAINCPYSVTSGEPCGKCSNCLQQNALNIHELDAASHNSAEDMRQVVEQTRALPVHGKKKVIIIDEAHMLSNAALNVLLKPLEDTPKHVVFILITTEKHKILPTILSRCQVFDFQPISLAHIEEQLRDIAIQEEWICDQEAIKLIAQNANGSLRDALSTIDLIATFSGEKRITYEATLQHLNLVDEETYFALTEVLYKNQIAEALLHYDTILRRGFDGYHFLGGLAQHLRNILVAQTASTHHLMQVSSARQQDYKLKAAAIAPTFIYSALPLVQKCALNYKASLNQRVHVEMLLIALGQISQPSLSAPPLGGTPPAKAKAASAPQGKSVHATATQPQGKKSGIASPAAQEAGPAATPTSPAPKVTLPKSITPRASLTPSAPTPAPIKASSAPAITTSAAPASPSPLNPKAATPLATGRAKKLADARRTTIKIPTQTEIARAISEQVTPDPQPSLPKESRLLSVIQKHWQSYITHHYKRPKAAPYTFKTSLTLSDQKIVLHGRAKAAQRADVEHLAQAFLSYLHQQLGDSKLSIAVEVHEPPAKKPYTDDERLTDLAARYEGVAYLQRRFELNSPIR